MTARLSNAAIAALSTAVLVAAACGPRKAVAPAVTPTARPARTTVVLLRDAGTDAVGRVRVDTKAGTVDLSTDRAAVTIDAGAAPGPVATASEDHVAQVFGDAIAALPAPAVRFVLHFQLGSDSLTNESRELLTRVVQTVRERTVPYVIVVGHTDTSGGDDANFALGLNRASAIRNLLVTAGLDVSSVEVISLGERDLLVPTPDDTQEPRNRRVEISVR